MKKLLFYFAIIMLPSALFAMSGSGSQADPWIIQDEDDLVTIMGNDSYWDDHIEIDLTSGTYLDMSTKTCSAIGSDSDPFTGHFDGKNVEIRNVTINTSSYYQGLFGYIEYPSTLQNVILKDVDITGDWYVGGLCGYNKGGTISFCSSSGDVNGTKSIGGICGINLNHYIGGNPIAIGTIENCSSSCNIDNEENIAGGLCGQNDNAIIRNCFSTGRVECGMSWTGTSRAGGFCGWNNGYGTISGCYSSGNVIAEGMRAGGFIGFSFRDGALIENCYSSGNVSGKERVGGFIGDATQAEIKNCYSTGDAEGEDKVGGFCGMSGRSDFEKCYSTGIPVATSGTIEGGFIGDNDGTCTCNFWNTSTSGKNIAVGNGSDDGITGLNNSQFSDQSYFESCYNFEEKWIMSDSGPVLKALTIPTLTEWAAIGFISLLAIVGGIFIWRKMV